MGAGESASLLVAAAGVSLEVSVGASSAEEVLLLVAVVLAREAEDEDEDVGGGGGGLEDDGSSSPVKTSTLKFVVTSSALPVKGSVPA